MIFVDKSRYLFKVKVQTGLPLDLYIQSVSPHIDGLLDQQGLVSL